VLFALLWLALPGFVGLGKVVYTRTAGEWPSGPGDDWISIPGYLNTKEPSTFELTKGEILNIALYGVPVFLGGLFLGFGRLTCGAAPRSSGAKGMFALSGIFTFVALAGLLVAVVCDKLLFEDEYRYARLAFLIAGCTAEFWFLNALTASGVSLKRPKAARQVGFIGFVAALLAVVVTIGWPIYDRQLRPRPLTEDWHLYEQAGLLLAWVFVVGTYWRAVGSVRAAVREFLDTLED